MSRDDARYPPFGADSDELSTAFQRAPLPPDEPQSSFLLQVVSGPDAGSSLAVPTTSAPRVLIGTSQTCDFRLTDRQVSRRHAALEIDGTSLTYTDLESKNGTWVGTM